MACIKSCSWPPLLVIVFTCRNVFHNWIKESIIIGTRPKVKYTGADGPPSAVRHRQHLFAQATFDWIPFIGAHCHVPLLKEFSHKWIVRINDRNLWDLPVKSRWGSKEWVPATCTEQETVYLGLFAPADDPVESVESPWRDKQDVSGVYWHTLPPQLAGTPLWYVDNGAF